WPTYGYDAERLRFVPGLRLRPPFRRVWMFRAQALVEFPPVIAYGRLYVATNAGDVFAVSLKTGRRAWVVHSHRCQAASPAVDDHLVYVTFLNRPPCNTGRSNVDGLVAAYDSRTGRLRWQKHVAPTESSPLVANGAVYVGDWSGRVYALAKGTGRQLWSFKTGDKVKGAVAVSGKRLYVGS